MRHERCIDCAILVMEGTATSDIYVAKVRLTKDRFVLPSLKNAFI